jgi:SAM-dependent MidA family methyltransferase
MRRFQLDDDPLEGVGTKDLTAHVDFGNLRRCAFEAGLGGGEICSLRVFLISNGAGQGTDGSTAERMALRHLLVSEIGDAHRVMLVTQGLPPREPRFGRRRLDWLVQGGGAPAAGGPGPSIT